MDDYENNKDNVDTEETDEYDEYYDYEHVYNCDNVLPPIVCPADSSCVTRTKCGRKGIYLLEKIIHEQPRLESRPVNPNYDYGISGMICPSNYSVLKISICKSHFQSLGSIQIVNKLELYLWVLIGCWV